MIGQRGVARLAERLVEADLDREEPAQTCSRASPLAFHGVGPSSVSVSLMLAMLEVPTRSASIAVTSAMK